MSTVDYTRIRTRATSTLLRAGTTATVKRSASDSYGDTGVYSTVATGVPCWVGNGLLPNTRPYQESASNSRTSGIPGGVNIYFDNSQDIRIKDELTIGGQVYEVGIVHNESPLNFLLQVDATLRRVPA